MLKYRSAQKMEKGQNLHIVGAHGGLVLSSITQQLFVFGRKS
jgi:hypothetical protein